ncbi:putative non-specific serine/threonine protein kinase [Helianthus anomalus]
MSDLRTAAPRIPNYYAASTRRATNGNRTVYAIAQCNLNLSQSVCHECLNSRYSSLDACLPGTNGRAVDNGCFMRYSSTPFFGLNQTTDLTPFLGDGEALLLWNNVFPSYFLLRFFYHSYFSCYR